jgi:hypothetical protein
VQAEHSNHRKLRRLRAGVVSVAVEGPLSAGQVCDEKTNVCEPLLTHRKYRTMASKPGLSGVPGMKARPRWCALSQEAACVPPWRCPVYRWRELVVGAGMEQENLSSRYRSVRQVGVFNPPRSARGRPPSGRNREGQSTDAGHRGGPVRRSAGINRHGGGDGRALRRRSSDPRRP